MKQTTIFFRTTLLISKTKYFISLFTFFFKLINSFGYCRTFFRNAVSVGIR
uniref:Uncharacterized protein n=1 Tax=Moraxella bovis TaxID=476 RepID=Q5KT99_MORBO|nr:hypothetical protein [Moraxella bovis Epp63]